MQNWFPGEFLSEKHISMSTLAHMVIFDFLASSSAWTTVLAAYNLGCGGIHDLPLQAVSTVVNLTKTNFSSSLTVHKPRTMWKNVIKIVFVQFWAVYKKSFFFSRPWSEKVRFAQPKNKMGKRGGGGNFEIFEIDLTFLFLGQSKR